VGLFLLPRRRLGEAGLAAAALFVETPRHELYYFKPDELLSLKLATQADDGKTKRARS
jgi:hypothetical protein